MIEVRAPTRVERIMARAREDETLDAYILDAYIKDRL